MKIVCISTARVPSDTANSIQVMKTCQALARSGHTVELLVPGNKPADWDELAVRYGLSTAFPISWLPSNPRWKRNDFAWESVRSVPRRGADLIYTWTGQSAVFGLLHRIPVIFEVHDLPTGMLGPLWFRTFLRWPGRKRLAFITRALENLVQDRYGRIDPAQVVIAPNGVDLDQYDSLPDEFHAREALGLPQTLTVSCSGHLYAGRGVDLFIGLAERFPQASFVWVGGRPEDVAICRTRVQSSGLKNIIFTGFIPQQHLPLYQAAADVLLMPYSRSIAGSSGGNSADICSPMKMFDYLAAGRVIISSDLPVIHEILNESNAVFAPPEDLQGWSAALAHLISDQAQRERLSAQARLDAPLYTWRNRAERVLDGF